ncbi:RND family transporter [bacterium]|nr:RND family transporter [bacterium]MCB9476108.1 RND family transporter [Deltaproteobacteria bacterium]
MVNSENPRWVEIVLRRRRLVLAVVGVVTAVLIFFAARIEFDSSMEIWFLEHDPTLVTYHRFLDRFAAEEISIVGLIAPDRSIFHPETLKTLRHVTEECEKAPWAHRVTSLTNLRMPQAVGDTVEITPMVPEKIPESDEEINALREKVLGNPLLTGSLVSEDGAAAAVVIQLTGKGLDFDAKIEHTEYLKALKKRLQDQGWTIHLAGAPVFDEAFLKYSQRDFSVFGPVTLVLVILCVFFVYRRFSAAVIPLSVVGLTLVWTFGLMNVFGVKLNVISTAMTGLILAVGIADSVHILSEYYQEMAGGKSPEDAVRGTMAHMLTPCFFTSITTAAGMLSLLVSDLRPVRVFGVFSAISVLIALGLSFTFLPAVLRFAKPPSAEFVESQKRDRLSRMLAAIAHPQRRASGLVLLATLVFVGVCVWGLSRLTVGANAMNYFKPDEPVRLMATAIDEALGGSASVEFLVEAPNEGLKEPEVLQRIDTFERWMESRPGINQALSIVDSLKEMNRVFHDGDREYFTVPDSRPLAAQYYLLMEGEDDFENSVQENYSVGRISARLSLSQAAQLSHEVPLIEKEVKRAYHDDQLKLSGTGFVHLMSRMENYLLDSQIKSFSIAFVVIILMMMLLLRSFTLGLFAMIPNLSPILMGIGIMGLTRISLDPGTVMIGSIAMGLVVDDTVHFLVRMKRKLANGGSIEEGIAYAMYESGRPIVITSVVLALGFSVLMLGSFMPNIYFGFISAIIIMLALACDLIVLPAALVVLRPTIR